MGGVISTLANAPPDDRSARDNRCEIYVRRTQTGEKWIFTFSSEVDIGKEYQNEAETNGVEYCVQYFDKDYLARSKEGIDYTQFFAPLRMWPLLRRTYVHWMIGRNRRNENNVLGLRKKLQVNNKVLLGCEETNHEFNHMLLHEFNNDMRLWCRHKVDLPFPKTEGNSFGYSWTAWKTAAIYAGAKEPSITLNHLANLFKRTLEYYADMLRKYQSEEEIFAIEMDDVNTRQWTADSSHYDVPSDEGDQTRIAFRMTDLVQSILTCQAALERIERLRELGMLEGGKVAAIQAKTTGPIQETYSILHSYTESLMVKKQSELQIFAGDMGVRKGKRIWFQSQPKLPYDITNQTLESHILVMESDSVLAL